MKVDDEVKPLGPELRKKLFEVPAVKPEFINVRIVSEDGLKLLFCDVVDLGVLQLLFHSTYYRRCEHNVADGGETDEQDLFACQ